MEHGKFKYNGPYNAQAFRKLFPNAHFADGPGGSQQQQQQPNMQQGNSYGNPYMPGRMAQPEVLSFGSNTPPGLAYPQVFFIVSSFQLFWFSTRDVVQAFMCVRACDLDMRVCYQSLVYVAVVTM